MIFGLEGAYFNLGPIPVDHLVVTQWGIVAVIGLLAFFGSKDMQVCPKGLQNGLEWIVVWTNDFFTSLMDKEHIAKKYAPLLSTFFFVYSIQQL